MASSAALTFRVVFTVTDCRTGKNAQWRDGTLLWHTDKNQALLKDATSNECVERFALVSTTIVAPELELKSPRHTVHIEEPICEGAKDFVSNLQSKNVVAQERSPAKRVATGVQRRLQLPPLLLRSLSKSRIPFLPRSTSTPPSIPAQLRQATSEAQKAVSATNGTTATRYRVTWTADLRKVHKNWGEGIVVYNSNRRLKLYDDTGELLENALSAEVPAIGKEIKTDAHIVVFEELHQGPETTADLPNIPSDISLAVKPNNENSDSEDAFNVTVALKHTLFSRKVPRFVPPLRNPLANSVKTSNKVLALNDIKKDLSSKTEPEVQPTSHEPKKDFQAPAPLPKKVFLPQPMSTNVGLTPPKNLYFKLSSDCFSKSFSPMRRIQIPNVFPSLLHYQNTFLCAIREHLQVSINLIADSISAKLFKSSANNSSLRDADICAAFGKCGYRVHTDCDLVKPAPMADLLLLKISAPQQQDVYSRDDLWMVWSKCQDFFDAVFLQCAAPFLPSSNKLEVIPVSFSQSSYYPNFKGRPCFATCLIQKCGELSVIPTLLKLHLLSEYLPVLPLLLDPQKKATQKQDPTEVTISTDVGIRKKSFTAEVKWLDSDSYEKTAIDVCRRLNADQKTVLREFAHKLRNLDTSLTLVHGVFGSGKSSLAAAIIQFFLLISPPREHLRAGSSFRLLVASNTNVAVDRILETLVQIGITEFVRVGNKRKIHASVVPFSHGFANGPVQQQKQDANLSNQAGAFGVATDFSNQLGGLQAPLDVAKARVVGSTLMSTLCTALENQRFDILLLDECSQFTEPLALLALRLGVKHLICVGDPMQLPPTLKTKSTTKNGLEKTLFERLNFAGAPTMMLTTQYRCHEKIANLASQLFYDPVLKRQKQRTQHIPCKRPRPACEIEEGEVEKDSGFLIKTVRDPARRQVAVGLPTLVVVDVNTGEESKQRSTFVNEAEAHQLCALHNWLATRIDVAARVGVVATYRGQTELLSERLDDSGVIVGTVDAFQGGERDIVLVSCVRTSFVDFIDSPRRLNVLLTRAREHLVIFGCVSLLKTSPLWARILDAAEITTSSELMRKLASQTLLAPPCNPQVMEKSTIQRPISALAPYAKSVDTPSIDEAQVPEANEAESVKSASTEHASSNSENGFDGLREFELLSSYYSGPSELTHTWEEVQREFFS